LYWFIIARHHFTDPKRSCEIKKVASSDCLQKREKKDILDTKEVLAENQNEKSENEKGENEKGENVINVA
jgi:hypothetical protein